MMTAETDAAVRSAAFEHVEKLSKVYEYFTKSELQGGFYFKGERYPLVNPQRGIFKPRQMRYLLSIKTVIPKPGQQAIYDDQHQVHTQIFQSRETIDYSFMGSNPAAADNRWLREAYENKIPIIYFLGIAPGRYTAILPSYIAGWNPDHLQAQVSFAPPAPDIQTIAQDAWRPPPETAIERRYALRTVQQRLHQDIFRNVVITAYDGRCAITGIPEPRLLDAAHIMPDKDEKYGQPVVQNGLPLSKTHHAAFDAHLIGIDPDYFLHVSETLLELHDGPLLESIKQLKGRKILLPSAARNYPDQNRLAERFEEFRKVA